MSADPAEPAPRFTPAQWLLLGVLALVQFTHIVDFMILMPLATDLQEAFGIRTQAFGVLVSAYGFAACLAGLVLAPWLDRFDRKPTLLVLFAGFTLGTLLCAFAPNFWILLLGRGVAGGFGGVMAAVVLAIVGDAFPPARRGTAMGAVMSAFSLASIAGVPAGLALAQWSAFGWRAPFAVLGVGCFFLLLLACYALPSVAGHLGGEDPPARFLDVVSRPAHLRAFLLMFALVFSGFSIFPYIAPFLVKNVGMAKEYLPLIYLFGGAATLVSMNLIGRLADRFPRRVIFRVFATAAIVPMVAISLLPPGTPLFAILTVTTLLMILSSGRMVPAMAMITSAAEPRVRGSFLSINASVQQFGAGAAPLFAGLLLQDDGPASPVVGYPLVGLVAGTAALASVFLVGLLHPAAMEPATPSLPEAILPVVGESAA
jgi:MFS transporter, DHA1 family, inner membrane transport protein